MASARVHIALDGRRDDAASELDSTTAALEAMETTETVSLRCYLECFRRGAGAPLACNNSQNGIVKSWQPTCAWAHCLDGSALVGLQLLAAFISSLTHPPRFFAPAASVRPPELDARRPFFIRPCSRFDTISSTPNKRLFYTQSCCTRTI